MGGDRDNPSQEVEEAQFYIRRTQQSASFVPPRFTTTASASSMSYAQYLPQPNSSPINSMLQAGHPGAKVVRLASHEQSLPKHGTYSKKEERARRREKEKGSEKLQERYLSEYYLKQQEHSFMRGRPPGPIFSDDDLPVGVNHREPEYMARRRRDSEGSVTSSVDVGEELGATQPDGMEQVDPRYDEEHGERVRTFEEWEAHYAGFRERVERSTLPGVQELGIAPSREDDFGSAWRGYGQRGEARNRGVPSGLVQLAQTRAGIDDEENVGATQYHVDAAHHARMRQALIGKPPTAEVSGVVPPKETVRRRLKEDARSVSRSLKVAKKVEESTEKWMEEHPLTQRTRRTRTAVLGAAL